MSTTASSTLPSAPSLGLGMIPNYPTSLLLSESVIVDCILADIPFFITGMLAFAIITFFIIVRQANRYITLVAISVFIDFIAGLLDLTQLLVRGGKAVQTGVGISSRTAPLIVSREVALSLSPGFLFLFFWFYVAVPPRGELEKPYGGRSYSRALGIVNYPDAYHSARWDRWGLLGVFLQWLILASITAVPVLQAAWRTTAFTVAFSPIYNASATLEIILSSVLILKLLGNVWMSRVLSRWKTLRDYLPAIGGLLLGLGVSVGNTITFKFSETALGRLLQALETYILILYILTGTFYVAPTREGTLPPPFGTNPFDGPSPNAFGSNEAVSGSAPDLARAIATNRPSIYYRGSRSTITRFSTWLTRGVSNRPEQRDTNNFTQDDESDVFPRIQDKEKKEQQYFDSYYYNAPGPVAISEKPVPEKNTPAQTSAVQNTEPATIQVQNPTRPTSPVAVTQDMIVSPQLKPPSIARDSSTSTSSPVYGLNGIIGKDQFLSLRDSARNSDLSSLLRQQEELDKSVAGLQLYSGTPVNRYRLTASPTQSEFSLSRFPEPPFALNKDRFSNLTKTSITGDDFVVDNMEFTLVPPVMPATTGEGGRATSFPISSRGSDTESFVLPNRTRVLDSGGTQYDVTSFIGGLTGPTSLPTQTALSTIPSDDETSPTAFTVTRPAPQPTRSDVPPRPVVTPLVIKSGLQTIRPQLEVDESTVAAPAPKRNNASLRRPNAPKISAPVARESVDQPTAFERPRRPPAAAPPASFK